MYVWYGRTGTPLSNVVMFCYFQGFLRRVSVTLSMFAHSEKSLERFAPKISSWIILFGIIGATTRRHTTICQVSVSHSSICPCYDQCDQIWQNFATQAKFLKSLGTCCAWFFKYLSNFCTNFAIFMPLGKLSLV